MRGTLRSMSLTLDGKQVIALAVDSDFREEYDALYGKELEIELKPYKEKRSRNANNFMWELCGKLSGVTGLPPVEIYRNAIKEVNVFQDIAFTQEKAANTMAKSWSMHGIGWQCEKVDYTEDGGVIMRFYYGSSTFNKAQMARLINVIVEDCRELGIECGSERERSLLIDNWIGELK